MLIAELILAVTLQTPADKVAFIRFQTAAAIWKNCTKRYVSGQPVAEREATTEVVAQAIKNCVPDQNVMHCTLLNDGLSSTEADELVAMQINLWRPKLFDEAVRLR